MKRNLPNAITALRVALTPLIALFLLQPFLTARLAAFVFFLIAAVSDLWDGYLARSRNQITDFGKLVDPVADKLLLVATLVPIYVVTIRHSELRGLPVFDGLPLWALLVLLSREALITVLRTLWARRGYVVAARSSGKRKTLAQNIYIGSMILWIALRTGMEVSERNGPGWHAFELFHAWFVTGMLAAALALTVYSMTVYFLSFRHLVADKPA